MLLQALGLAVTDKPLVAADEKPCHPSLSHPGPRVQARTTKPPVTNGTTMALLAVSAGEFISGISKQVAQNLPVIP